MTLVLPMKLENTLTRVAICLYSHMKILINMLNNWEMTESESGYNALPFIALFMFTQRRLKLFTLQNLCSSSQSCLYDFICAMNCF